MKFGTLMQLRPGEQESKTRTVIGSGVVQPFHYQNCCLCAIYFRLRFWAWTE